MEIKGVIKARIDGRRGAPGRVAAPADRAPEAVQ